MKTLKGVLNTFTGKYEDVEVTDAVYTAYMRSEWNIADNDESFFKHEIQLSSLIGNLEDSCENFHEFHSETRCLEHLVANKVQVEEILKSIQKEPPENQRILIGIFVDRKSERRLSTELGIPQKTINNRKRRFMEKVDKKQK